MANKFPLILNTSANQIQEIASGDNLDLTGCKIVGLQGINSAGIVTFTKAHVGAATTWGEDLVVTGNARVTGILTVGTNSVTINGNDVNITGVTTASNFKTGTSILHNVGIELAGLNVLGADTPKGTGATIYNSGAAVFTGIVTAANYVGTINTPAQPNITSVGTLSALNVSGNVSIGGTLTYEDVTNIDAVGLITARNGINVSGGTATFAAAIDANSNLDVDGHTNLDNVSIAGVTTFTGNTIRQNAGYVSINVGSTNAGGAALVLDGDSNGDFTGNDYSLIQHNTDGHLIIQANAPAAANVYIKLGASGHYGAMFKEGAESLLRYNNSTKIATTDTGAQFSGTDFGFGATPGGTPASKNVFLAIGDSDTGIVQDGDGQLELWANAVEVANINAIDGYTSTKPITTTGNVSVGDFTAKSALFTDNGTASPVVELRTDDGGPWALQIANDTYSNGSHGLHLNQQNDGVAVIRNIGSSSYHDIIISVQNGGTTHDTLTIDQSGLSVLGTSGVTAGRLNLYDNGATGPILNVRTDDNSPWALTVGNDTYNTGCGQMWYQDNNGDFYQRVKYTSAGFKNWYFQVTDGSTTNNAIKIDNNRSVSLHYQGSSRLYTASGGTGNDPGVVVENGILQVTCTNDWQIQCKSTNAWTGIKFTDSSSSDHLWYAGSNGTFAIGGGGSNVTGKKLHIDGAVTIGNALDNLTVETNGLKIQGPIDVGVNSVADSISRFTNEDSGSAHFTHLAGRVLHSNGSGWDGNNSTDGVEPMIVCTVSDRAGNSDIGDSCGIMMHSESDDANDYSPIIGFSARAESTNYNSVYAAIVGKKTGTAADTNWNAGQLNFYTAGKESNRANDQYMDSTPDFFINRRGYTGTPRHPRFRAWRNVSNWSVSANEEMIWNNTEYNIGTCYSTSTGRFTAPVDGFYSFRFYSITYKHSTNDAVYVKINGNRQKGGDTHFSTHGTNWENVGWTGIFSLTAGQYVSVFNGGSAVTYHGDNWSAFEGYLVSSETW